MIIHTLGCGSAKPTLRHQPSSTILENRGNLFMIDCGEGAQTAMQRNRLNMNRLSNIFITHLHGDHVFGLPGLMGTMALSGNAGEITIHTFREGKEILERIFSFFNHHTDMDIRFNVIDPNGEDVIWENSSFTVRTVPLKHSIPAVGYLFEEKPGLRHLNRAMCDFHGVPTSRFNLIKHGEDFVKPDGTVVPNALLTTPPTPPKRYAHISDTAYMPGLAKKIEGFDLLFHETTYLEEHLREAKMRGHSTAAQAATVARDANVGRLLTGHYSSRYKTDEGFLKEASAIFPNTILNCEGLITEV